LLTLVKSGMFTTIQDRGRFCGAHLGIPMSGALDQKSADITHLLLENDLHDAVLECTFTGPEITFHAPTIIAIAGAQINAYINKREVDTTKYITIHSGDHLQFGRIKAGCRFYIGVKGGIQSPVIFGSRSMCTTDGTFKPLANGVQLEYIPFTDSISSLITLNRRLDNHEIEVQRGPEFSLLATEQVSQLFRSSYKVASDSSRMAYHVRHSLDLTHHHSMLSSGTLPGTVQCTPQGKLVFLLKDGQTSGGYPRILQLTEDAMNDLAQMMPNNSFILNLLD